ncbi:hypothetical protein VCRA2112O349_20199 [Vibrio crassostreae]|nr:hypothetical protein VCRA2113O351_10582 [Vibrio crassostreae]CAK2002598.1 hypothetical protein VCRA2113O362_20199 [Vibrio crassostreae]CAK2006981.1 hypothetical protein VCRA2113O359_20199 [Vibrio crassostreae]CAK2016952.1 hypothetical protein VCRA2113O199_20316 [Vibrio crassostreae]CAK2018792.1 hypothetical protein VCRA2113O354_20314 [Vibrio crassostreae]
MMLPSVVYTVLILMPLLELRERRKLYHFLQLLLEWWYIDKLTLSAVIPSSRPVTA